MYVSIFDIDTDTLIDTSSMTKIQLTLLRSKFSLILSHV